MNTPQCYVLIPVHNRVALTRRVLGCLQQQTVKNFTTIVIDDGSNDGTSEMIADQFPTVEILHGTGDLFWTGAINMGLCRVLETAAEGDLVLLLNDDLEFDKDYISTIIELANRHNNALVGSVVVDLAEPDTIFDGGCRIDFWTAKYTYLNHQQSLSSFPKGTAFEVSTLTGRGVAIPVGALRQTGLYDEKHFRHRGDTELPIRAQHLGYDLMVCYDAVVKCHTHTTYELHADDTYNLLDTWDFFFDFRSYGHLRWRYHFAKKTTSGPYQFASFLTFDVARLVTHFVRRLRWSLTPKKNPGGHA